MALGNFKDRCCECDTVFHPDEPRVSTQWGHAHPACAQADEEGLLL